MLHNAFAYVTRKFFKSIVIFLIILLMASLSLVGLSIKGATAKASQETFKNITNSEENSGSLSGRVRSDAGIFAGLRHLPAAETRHRDRICGKDTKDDVRQREALSRC